MTCQVSVHYSCSKLKHNSIKLLTAIGGEEVLLVVNGVCLIFFNSSRRLLTHFGEHNERFWTSSLVGD